MSVEQIKLIILGSEETLRLLLNQPEYHEIASSEKLGTANKLGLMDAIQILSELHDAIEEAEHDMENNLPRYQFDT
ncbi:hypothetical protein [Microcoleus sp. B13-B4]